MNHQPNCAISEKLSDECSCGPRVFLVNEPLKRNHDGELERWLPLGTLSNFGEVVRCLPDGSPPASLDGYLSLLRAKLEGWRDGDMIALVGDQSLLVAAAMIVGARTGGTGKVKVLKWERRQESYAPVVLNLGATPRPTRPSPANLGARLTGDDLK